MKLVCVHDKSEKRIVSEYLVHSKRPNLTRLHDERPDTMELINVLKTRQGKLLLVYHDCTKGKLSVFYKG